MKPAEYVISLFGGVRPTARALNLNPATIVRWKKAREDGGSGGYIPTKNQTLILSTAERMGIAVDPARLVTDV